jgi:hypothetical protein
LLRSLFCANWQSIAKILTDYCRGLGFVSFRFFDLWHSQKLNWIVSRLVENMRYSSVVSPRMHISVALYLVCESYLKLAFETLWFNSSVVQNLFLLLFQLTFVFMWLRKLRKEWIRQQKTFLQMKTPLSVKLEIDEGSFREKLFQMYYPVPQSRTTFLVSFHSNTRSC